MGILGFRVAIVDCGILDLVIVDSCWPDNHQKKIKEHFPKRYTQFEFNYAINI
jgi:hypothetical protein